MSSLSWKHHALIQALMTRGPLKEKDFHAIFSGVTGKHPGAHQELFNEYLLKINRELSSCQFELRASRDQYAGQVCYGVVNNVADEQSKLGTKYSVQQITFFKGILRIALLLVGLEKVWFMDFWGNRRILKRLMMRVLIPYRIEAIAQDVMAQGSISNFDVLNIRLENQVLASKGSQSQDGPFPAAFRNFTMSQKEKTLDELVLDKWLCRTPDGKIGLGVRSFLDLRGWFRNLDVPSCEVCNEAVVKGELCPNEGCAVRIHHYCLKKKFSQRRGEMHCPLCGLQWQNQLPKAEILDEEEETANDHDTIQSQPPPGPKRKRTQNADAVGRSSSQSSVPPNSEFRRRTRSRASQR